MRFDNLWLSGNGAFTNNGIYITSHTLATNIDVSGCNEGVRMLRGYLQGARIEANITGLNLGTDYTGSQIGATECSVEDVTFETNVIGWIIKTSNSYFRNINVTGFENNCTHNPDGSNDPDKGIVVVSASNSVFERVKANAFCQGYPAWIVGDMGGCQFNQCEATNLSTGDDWGSGITLANGNGNVLRHSNVPFASYLSLASRATETQSLLGVDHLSPPVAGKNLRFIAYPVGAGLSTVTVTFSPGFTGGQVDFSTLTASNGAGTLPPATYYYLCSVITPGGECPGIERSVVVSAPNDTVNIVTFGLSGATTYKRRIYRGIASGAYDGYYELALNTDSYTDTNAAFTVTGVAPPSSGNNNSMQEPDTAYGVVVTPNWLTDDRVTSKATTGFTVDFGTAAPGGGGAIDIVIVR
jgi:hypothetical protein